MIDVATFELSELLPFIAVGFAAQMVDGALGMAFGVISTTLLLSLGVPPATASAGVHAVESFTTAASGTSHIIHRNIEWRLFARLVVPGVIGGVIGAYLLTRIDAAAARPVILAYLSCLPSTSSGKGCARSRRTGRRDTSRPSASPVAFWMPPGAEDGDRSLPATSSSRVPSHGA